MQRPKFILASASPRRLALLKQVGIIPDEVIPAGIDETPLSAEIPSKYALRIARAKAKIISDSHPDAVVLAADTVVACGRRILPKAEDEASARECLHLLSGRRHRVYTAVVIIHAGTHCEHLAMTQVAFRKLTKHEIDGYIACGEWQGKAGGYAIQGAAESFIPWISGSYSNVVGLPLEKTCRMLESFKIKGK